MQHKKGEKTMEETPTQTTFRITLPNADTRFLKRLSESMGWQVVRVPATHTLSTRKVTMTEAELCKKIAQAKQQYAAGEVVAMQPNETAEDFMQRLCTR